VARAERRPPSLERDELVAAVDRGQRSQVQVRRCRSVTGFEFIDVRVWERDWGANPYRRTVEGFALAVELAPALVEVLRKAGSR
jgi:hypothetical protein